MTSDDAQPGGGVESALPEDTRTPDERLIDHMLYGTHRMNDERTHVLIAWETWQSIGAMVERLRRELEVMR